MPKKQTWKCGDRVQATVDGVVYEGKIKLIFTTGATVAFDDGDTLRMKYKELEKIESLEEVGKPEMPEPEPEAPETPKEPEPPEEIPTLKETMTKDHEEALERELRRYVAKMGGFRKNLSPERKKIAESLMKKLGREKPEWNHDIITVGSNSGCNPYREKES